MNWDNQVSPEQLYMNPGEATAYLGIDRNELRALCIKKLVSWDYIAGRTLYYRTSIEAYKDKRDNSGKKEQQHA